MKRLPVICYILLTVCMSAVYLPMLYEKIFFDDVEKTHLFYSPVSQDFIYKEKIVGPVPEEAKGMALDHHTGLAYRKADGTYVPRQTFEKHLPFIFYKNMEIWGLLPITLSDKTFDKKTIKANRHVMELKSRDIPDKSPHTPLYPLLESNPGQARLVFPDDRFRMEDNAMVFINADTNRVDPKLTDAFTKALKEKGFRFPVRSVNGKFTVLKPFDEGVFLVDANYSVFHVKRVDGKTWVVKTPIPSTLKVRHIKVSENKQRAYYGLVLLEDGRAGLLSYDGYTITPLPLTQYDPDNMDLKLIFNPLYCTAIYSDDTVIRAIAMDRTFTPISSYTHTMSRATPTLANRVEDVLFPFWFRLGRSGSSAFIKVSMGFGSGWSLLGIIMCTLIFLGLNKFRKGRWPKTAPVVLVALTGIYGLIAATIVDPDQ
ncbi:MAG: DUF4857 domain-containing protein [Desulfobacterales bacterium]|nr:MAG: DUF4857 domain-containing protein [Desulfobacterales bacterium]